MARSPQKRPLDPKAVGSCGRPPTREQRGRTWVPGIPSGCHTERGKRAWHQCCPVGTLLQGSLGSRGNRPNGGKHGQDRGEETDCLWETEYSHPLRTPGRFPLMCVPQGRVLKGAAELPPTSINLFSHLSTKAYSECMVEGAPGAKMSLEGEWPQSCNEPPGTKYSRAGQKSGAWRTECSILVPRIGSPSPRKSPSQDRDHPQPPARSYEDTEGGLRLTRHSLTCQSQRPPVQWPLTPPHLRPHLLPPFPSLTSLQAPWPPCCSRNAAGTLLPRGLCPCCSLCMKRCPLCLPTCPKVLEVFFVTQARVQWPE